MILVTGATGNVGGKVVSELVAAGAPVRALARDPGRTSFPAEVEVVEGDLGDPPSLAPALEGIERAFLLTPFVPRQDLLQENFVAAAGVLGGIHVVKMGAIGAAADSPLALGREHARGEELLKASGLPFTILNPHSFMQNLLGSAASIAGEGVIYGCLGEGRIAPVDTRDVAAVAAAILTGGGHEGKTYLVTGPEALTQHEVAARVGSAIGRDVRYVDVSPGEFKQAVLQWGLPEVLADDLVALYADVFAKGGAEDVTTVVADVTGRPARSVEAFARDHAAVLRGN